MAAIITIRATMSNAADETLLLHPDPGAGVGSVSRQLLSAQRIAGTGHKFVDNVNTLQLQTISFGQRDIVGKSLSGEELYGIQGY